MLYDRKERQLSVQRLSILQDAQTLQNFTHDNLLNAWIQKKFTINRF